MAADVATIEWRGRETDNFLSRWPRRSLCRAWRRTQRHPYLRKALNVRDTITDRTLALDPWWDKLHARGI